MPRVRWQLRFSSPELYQEMVKNYYRLITGVDAVVGEIRNKLDELGYAENTVIALLGDNGFFLGEYGCDRSDYQAIGLDLVHPHLNCGSGHHRCSVGV